MSRTSPLASQTITPSVMASKIASSSAVRAWASCSVWRRAFFSASSWRFSSSTRRRASTCSVTSTAVDPDRELGANEGRTGGVDLIQDGKYPLLHQFGPHLTGGLAHQISLVPVAEGEGIGKLDAMLRPT